MDEEYSIEEIQLRERIAGLERQLQERKTESEQMMRKGLQDALHKEKSGVMRSAALCVLCMLLLWYVLPLYGFPFWMVLLTIVPLAVSVLVEVGAAWRLAAIDVLKGDLAAVEKRMLLYRRFVRRWYSFVVFPFLLVWLCCFLLLVRGNIRLLIGACVGGTVGLVSGVLLFRYTLKRADGFVGQIKAIRERLAGEG